MAREEIINTAKLRLFANNIKVNEFDSEYIYLVVKVMDLDDVNFLYNISLNLEKDSSDYGVSKSVAGTTFSPRQGAYGSMGVATQKIVYLPQSKELLIGFLWTTLSPTWRTNA